jgi:hypothetical protein
VVEGIFVLNLIFFNSFSIDKTCQQKETLEQRAIVFDFLITLL